MLYLFLRMRLYSQPSHSHSYSFNRKFAQCKAKERMHIKRSRKNNYQTTLVLTYFSAHNSTNYSQSWKLGTNKSVTTRVALKCTFRKNELEFSSFLRNVNFRTRFKWRSIYFAIHFRLLQSL